MPLKVDRMEAELRDHLITLAEAYAVNRDVKVGTVSLKAAGDTGFIQKLKDRSGSFTVRKYDEAMAWFGANWPEGLPWPSEVPRPKVAA